MFKILLKILAKYARFAQALFVLVVFSLMVLISYIFVRNIEISHLRKDAANSIRYTEANIKSDLLEPDTLLGGISETLRAMLVSGKDKDEINEYIKFMNDYIDENNSKRLLGALAFFGAFDVFDNVLLNGEDIWIPPPGYNFRERPWYSGAVQAAGEVYLSEPYLNLYTNEMTISFSRQIYGRDGSALAVICLNVELFRIIQYVVNARFAENGYGFLLSESYIVIAHPNQEVVGRPFDEVDSDITALMEEYVKKGSISEVTSSNYRNEKSIVYIDKLYNGWLMGVVTPSENYFKTTRLLALNLSIFGAIFAVLLIWILMSIAMEKARSDERMQIMFNSMPLGVNIWDDKLNIIDCNDNIVKMFELADKKEYLEKGPHLVPEYQSDGTSTVEKRREAFAKALEKGENRYEWMNQKLDGSRVPVEVTLVRVKQKHNFLVIAYTRDLREQKQMMEIIQRRALLLDTVNTIAAILLANNDMSVFETSLMKCFDLIGHCMELDRVQMWRNELVEGSLHFALRYEWLSDFGRTLKPIPLGLMFPYSVKKDWEAKFLRGEYINAPIRELPYEDQAFLGFYEMKSVVIMPLFLDGNFWGLFSLDDCRSERSLSDEEINILSSAGLMLSSAVNRNIQATKMREAEERTQIMVDAAPLCAIFWDKNMRLVDCNQEAVNMFGLSSKQEFIEKFFQLSPEYQAEGVASAEIGGKLVRTALEEGYSRFEWMHQKLDGEPIPADVICIRVKHKDEFTVTEYIRDLREQKAMIAEMRKAEIAEESSKAKSDFLAKMSHEIRTPMNAILGITEIQIQDEKHSASTKEAFERIYNSGNLLLGIINDILDLSKIEAGKLIIVPAQYDVASLIHDTVQLIIMRYESKPLEFDLEVDEDIPMILVGDELRIKQILNNVLSNAFKYTEKGKVTFSVSIEPGSNNENVTIVFVVKDTGQGMTDEQIQKLGTEYSRFNMEANRRTEGAGLGMNITRNLIQAMKGNIAIESAPDEGSVFTVKLPQENPGSTVIGRELADNLMKLNIDSSMKVKNIQMKREFMPYGRVLIVDDVESNLYVAKGLLAPYGLSIDTAMSGYEAIDKIKNGSVFDIIFMDHMMPKMDGIEATQVIRSLGYTKPVVALTANALAGHAEMFMNNGFDDFISKPIDIRQLNVVLNKMIRDVYPQEVVDEARKQKKSLSMRSEHHNIVDPQLAEFFIRDAKKALSVLETVYSNKCSSEEDASLFIINVHAMKSALANIGETDLSAEAAKLEKAGREHNLKLILSELPSFLEALNAVIRKISPKEDKKANDASADDMPYLKENLLVVKKACETYDKKTAKKILADIREKQWSSAVNEQLSLIAGHLLHSDFDEAVKLIDSTLSGF
jgi:CheY-like chemotaxis protein/nitrogen-specific signal transduction histidine kinase/HPt (histidine-containing phosphotransfer) domain-containing protein